MMRDDLEIRMFLKQIYLKMELQNCLNLRIVELSNDEDMLSLFNKCESINWQQNNYAQQQQICEIPDLEANPKQIYKDYHSDEQGCIKKSRVTTRTRIINKKQQRKQKKHTKIYIKVLQNKITQLKTQIERLKLLNKVNKEYIHRLNQSEHLINGYFVGRQQVIQKLEHLNNQHQADSQKILEEIVSLRLRQGVYGKDRIKAVNYYFKEMVQMVLPQIQKYIIKTALEEQDFFDANYLQTGIPSKKIETWRKQMLQNIGTQIKQKQAKQYLFNNRTQIIRQANNFNQILKDLSRCKCRLTEQAKKLEQVLDRAHKQMRPVQISKSLCYIDKYRFEKNISLEHTFKDVFQDMLKKSYGYDVGKPFCIPD